MFFNWLRNQVRESFVGGVQDGMAECGITPPASLASVADHARTLAAPPEPIEEIEDLTPVVKKGRGK